MANGNNKAFDAMNAINEKDDIDLTGGEISAWFPTGKFLGMDVPKGTSDIVEGLVFLASGSPGPKVASALKSKIKADVAVKHFPPAMQEKIIGSAAEHMDYFKKIRSVSQKLKEAGKTGDAKKIFDAAVQNAPQSISKDTALKQIAGEKSVRVFAKKHGERLAEWDKKIAKLDEPTMVIGDWRAISHAKKLRELHKDQKVYRKQIEPLTEAAREKVMTTGRLKRYLEDFKYEQAVQAERAIASKSEARQVTEAVGKFSIPSLLDEFVE